MLAKRADGGTLKADAVKALLTDGAHVEAGWPLGCTNPSCGDAAAGRWIAAAGRHRSPGAAAGHHHHPAAGGIGGAGGKPPVGHPPVGGRPR